jgi:archaellum component FlaC
MARINKNINYNGLNTKGRTRHKSQRTCTFINEDGHRCARVFVGYTTKHTRCSEHSPDGVDKTSNQRNIYSMNAKSDDMRTFILELMDKDAAGLLRGGDGITTIKETIKGLETEISELKTIISAVNDENKLLRESSGADEIAGLKKQVESFRKTSLANSERIVNLNTNVSAITNKWGL